MSAHGARVVGLQPVGDAAAPDDVVARETDWALDEAGLGTHFSAGFETDGTLAVGFVRADLVLGAEELAEELFGHGFEVIEYWTRVFDLSWCELV